MQDQARLEHDVATEEYDTVGSSISDADNNFYHHTWRNRITSIKVYFMKIMYTIMLLDMGLAPIAFQMWQKK